METPMRALIVDDSRFVRGYLRGLLEEMGVACEEATDGQSGLDLLHSGHLFHFALVDWNMPVMNGLDFLRAVRNDPDTSELRVIMVTTESEMDRMVQAIEEGANEYVMKPFTRDIIAQKLEMVGLPVT